MLLPPAVRRFVTCALLAVNGSLFAQSVVINEIFYDPPDNTQPIEFVELHNSGATAVNVGGWRLEGGVVFNALAGTTIPAGGYFVIAENAAAFQARFGFAPGGVFTGGLSSDGERLQLRNSVGALVDEVTYGVGFPWPTAAKGAGASMELISPALDNDLGASWRSSGTPDNPAPVTTYIAPTDTAWRYRKGVSEASSPREAWRLTGFGEDASWLTGRTSVGYADADDNTVLDRHAERLLVAVFPPHFHCDGGADPGGAAAPHPRGRRLLGVDQWAVGRELSHDDGRSAFQHAGAESRGRCLGRKGDPQRGQLPCGRDEHDCDPRGELLARTVRTSRWTRS